MTAGFIGERLQIRIGVVVRNEHRVFTPEQRLDLCAQGFAFVRLQAFDHSCRHMETRHREVRSDNGLGCHAHAPLGRMVSAACSGFAPAQTNPQLAQLQLAHCRRG